MYLSKVKIIYLSPIFLLFISCNEKTKSKNILEKSSTIAYNSNIEPPEGMLWISGSTFSQGANKQDKMAMSHEKPAHQVKVDGFFIDQSEVTNAQFQKFVSQTEYVTTAEKGIDWEEVKLLVPEGTSKPHDSILQPGSLIFNKKVRQISNMMDISQWWSWKVGANWKHPEGPDSSIDGKGNYPVVHISYKDALAYCNWAKRRLPTEAEWELAAHGKNLESIFTWGNDASLVNENANTWQGSFPTNNKALDGFSYIAPTQSFPKNSIGLYDMAGNVWEWTQDWYNSNYYQNINQTKILDNPLGAKESYNPQNPMQSEKIIKGGSFLCHDSYCASYRISARMGMSTDSSSDHVGFRTVATESMILKE